MPTVALKGAKGGVGTSLIASNLALMLARSERCLLMDMAPISGGLDLLLGFEPDKGWADLLPVVDELTARHLKLAGVGDDGLSLLAAPAQAVAGDPAPLASNLASHFDWLVFDLAGGWHEKQRALMSLSDVVLLVTTLDPPALRACHRWMAFGRAELELQPQLVVNQWAPGHPVDPKALAESMQAELAAVFPYAPAEVSEQIHYGQPIANSSSANYGRALRRLINWIRRHVSEDSRAAG